MTARKRFWVFLVVALLFVNLGVGLRVYSLEAEQNGEREAFEKTRVLMRVLHLIHKDYVDAEKVDFTKLIYGAIKGMVSSLDPFSGFMTPDEYGEMLENTEGQFGGLGIIVTVRDDVLTVIAPIADTPGARAGLLAGDQIVIINGESTQNMKLSETVKLLKGEPGTAVTISVHRPSTGETMEKTIERALIPVANVKDTHLLEDKVGYVRLVQFNDPTVERLEKALDELLEQGAEVLILDLRNNPGGLLDSAVGVCSLFVPKDSLVVSTQGRQESQTREFRSNREPKFLDKPVAVLVNGGSASAAEIVAGCLQDWGRAVLVGEQTFGKGSVQNVIELPDGSALRLTTSMYYTPSKRVIHKHGIAPDIEVVLTDSEIREVLEAQQRAAAEPEQGPYRDRQLQRALDTLRSYDVYRQAQEKRFKALRSKKGASEKKDGDR